MERLRNFLTEEQKEFTNLMMKFIDSRKDIGSMKMNQKLVTIISIKFFLFHCHELGPENVMTLKSLISRFIMEDNPNNSDQMEGLSINFGFYGDLLYKTFGTFLLLDLERFMIHGAPIFEIIRNKEEYSENFPKKMISYTLLLDLLTTHSYKKIIETYERLKRVSQKTVLVPVDRALEALVGDSVVETNSYLRGVVLKGMLQLLQINPLIFEAFSVDRQEVLSLVILQWHNRFLRGNSEFLLSVLQSLSIFFIQQFQSSPETVKEVIHAFLIVAEFFFYLKRKKERFDRKKLDIDVYDQDLMLVYFKSLINLTKTNQVAGLGREHYLISEIELDWQIVSENLKN